LRACENSTEWQRKTSGMFWFVPIAKCNDVTWDYDKDPGQVLFGFYFLGFFLQSLFYYHISSILFHYRKRVLCRGTCTPSNISRSPYRYRLPIPKTNLSIFLRNLNSFPKQNLYLFFLNIFIPLNHLKLRMTWRWRAPPLAAPPPTTRVCHAALAAARSRVPTGPLGPLWGTPFGSVIVPFVWLRVLPF
jgi:hypothetical protein